MKAASLIAGILLACAVCAPVQARKGEGDFSRQQRFEERLARDERDGQPLRQFRRERQQAQGAQQEDPRRRRLSPEERRDLRRDIRDAGRDIYRLDPRRRFRD